MFEEKTTYKLRHLFLPVPLFTIALVACCAALRWFFLSDGGFLRANDDIFDAYLPFGLAAIFGFSLIAWRTGILYLGSRSIVRFKLRFLYSLTAMLITALPAVKSQEYLRIATSSVVHVHNTAAIASAALARYYFADTICMDRNRLIAHPTVWASYSGSGLFHATRFNFALAVLVPACDETASAASRVWIAFRYGDSTGSSPSESEKRDEYNKFLRDSQQSFDAVSPAKFRFLERLGPTSRYDYFKRALNQSGAASPLAPIILEPHTERFEGIRGNIVLSMLCWFGIGCLVWLLMTVLPSLDQENPRVKRELGASILN